MNGHDGDDDEVERGRRDRRKRLRGELMQNACKVQAGNPGLREAEARECLYGRRRTGDSSVDFQGARDYLVACQSWLDDSLCWGRRAVWRGNRGGGGGGDPLIPGAGGSHCQPGSSGLSRSPATRVASRQRAGLKPRAFIPAGSKANQNV